MFTWSLQCLSDEIALSLVFSKLISQSKAVSAFFCTRGTLGASSSLWPFIGVSSVSVFLLWWGAQHCTQSSRCCLLGLLQELAHFGLPFSYLLLLKPSADLGRSAFLCQLLIRPNSGFPYWSLIRKLSSMCPDSQVSKFYSGHNSEIKAWLEKNGSEYYW